MSGTFYASYTSYEPDTSYSSMPAEVAANIDWDQYSNWFLTNQISDLSKSEQELVRGLASSAISKGIARHVSEPRNVVALALLAKFADENDRAA